jgi:hypothetical protein
MSIAVPSEGPQRRAELSPDYFLDRIMAARRGGTQALLRQNGDACLPGCVIGEDDAAIGRVVRDDPCRVEAAPRPVKPGRTVCLRALDPLDVPLG